MHEFHHDYEKPKYENKVKLRYMDRHCFVYEIETEDFYKDIAKDVKATFDTSRYSKDQNRFLPIGKNKKVTGITKDELDGKNITVC